MTDIGDTDVSIMMQVHKTLLFNDSKSWLKRFGNEISMYPWGGCCDGAEVCELASSFTLTKLCDILQRENVGLNRDDGLVTVKQMPGPKLERKRKKITKTF